MIAGCKRETEEGLARASRVCCNPPMGISLTRGLSHISPRDASIFFFFFFFQLGVWTIHCSVRVLKLDLSVGCQQMGLLREALKSFRAVLSEVESWRPMSLKRGWPGRSVCGFSCPDNAICLGLWAGYGQYYLTSWMDVLLVLVL